MGENETILFDLPSKGRSHCWSYNAWKGRLALNFKGIPYKTQWVEYPDIAPLFKSYGIAPNPEGTAETPYSIPAVRLPDGRYVMESTSIAEALEAQQPAPSLRLDSAALPPMQAAVKGVVKGLGPIAKPRVPELVLNPAALEYFERTREKRSGMPLKELAKSPAAGEAAWAAADSSIAQVSELLAADTAGPYVLGAEASYADLVLAGLWHFMKVLDKDGDLFGRLMKYDESFPKHFAACQTWLERDD